MKTITRSLTITLILVFALGLTTCGKSKVCTGKFNNDNNRHDDDDTESTDSG